MNNDLDFEPIDQHTKLRVIGFAKEKHEGQRYGDEPYFKGHILRVVDNLMPLLKSVDQKWHNILICAAYLHDVVEDTDTTMSDLFKEFGNRQLMTTVLALTQKPNEQRWLYLKRLCENESAIYVKLADSITNFKKGISTGEPKRAAQYLDSMKFLMCHLEMHKGLKS